MKLVCWTKPFDENFSSPYLPGSIESLLPEGSVPLSSTGRRKSDMLYASTPCSSDVTWILPSTIMTHLEELPTIIHSTTSSTASGELPTQYSAKYPKIRVYKLKLPVIIGMENTHFDHLFLCYNSHRGKTPSFLKTKMSKQFSMILDFV